MSAVRAVSEVHDLVVSTSFSAMEVELPRDGACGCAVHHATAINNPTVGGCAGWDCGSMPAIRLLYSKNPVSFCHAEKGVRVLDVRCAKFALSPVRLGAFAGGKYKPVGKYIKGTAKDVAFFGAGYCYLELFIPEARVRVARILGPCPYVIDVLRLLRILGLGLVSDVELEEVKSGVWHVQVVSTTSIPGWVIASKLVSVVRSCADARVGAVFDVSVGLPGEFAVSGPNLAEAVGDISRALAWFQSRGMVMPAESYADIYLAISHPSQQAVLVSGGRGRVKRWALFGDACLRFHICAIGVARDVTPEDISRMLQYVANDRLALFANRVGLASIVAGGYDVSMKVMADSVEALVGLVCCYAGSSKAYEIFVKDLMNL